MRQYIGGFLQSGSGVALVIPRSLDMPDLKRIVVKCGTQLVTGAHGLNGSFIEQIAAQIASLMHLGTEVAYVTSGAVSSGRSKLGLSDDQLITRQVLAAVGQGPLMARYASAFASHGITVAQTLLSRADLAGHEGFLNARNALNGLLDQGVLPIANENDVVATEELRFGDNDPLSALIAELVGADLLILLTSTDGLYTSDPREHPNAELITDGHTITDEVLAQAAGAVGRGGSGGIRSKVQAARHASADGIEVIVARGTEPDVIQRIMDGERLGTRFAPQGTAPGSRERWLGSVAPERGTLRVGTGAQRALTDAGRSLLPSGIDAVDGEFMRGDVVAVVGPDRQVFARGLVNYGSRDLMRILGCPAHLIASVLGYDHGAEAVHRNNLVLINVAGI